MAFTDSVGMKLRCFIKGDAGVTLTFDCVTKMECLIKRFGQR